MYTSDAFNEKEKQNKLTQLIRIIRHTHNDTSYIL